MTSSGLVTLKEIRRMLKECAPDFLWEEKDHAIHVGYRGKWYRELPKGAHNKKGEIQRPYVRKLASQLDILPCAKDWFGIP